MIKPELIRDIQQKKTQEEGVATPDAGNNYQWHGQQWSTSGCAGTYNAPGWYSGDTLLTSSYRNPTTGMAYTPQELAGLGGSSTPIEGSAGMDTTTPTGAAPTDVHVGSPNIFDMTPEEYLAYMPEGTTIEEATSALTTSQQHITDQGGVAPTGQAPTTPTFGEGAGAGIPTPEVTPAPPYEISPEQQAFEDMYGGKLTDWVESGGYGIPEETQNAMIQQQTDSLKAREAESIRVMRNNMERRGITNSGFMYANEQNIRSNTSVAIAGAIADVQIKSALMKMSSFEKAMGAAGQFLGYLSEQSQLQYQPEFATWQAEQMAKMQVWQGKLDIHKMEINQAYQTQNMELQAQLQSQLNQEQNQFDLQLAEMEIKASQQAAQAQGFGSIIGMVIGAIFGKI